MVGITFSGKLVLGSFKSGPSQYFWFTKQNLGKVPLFSGQQFKLPSEILVGNCSWVILKSGDGWTYAMSWGWLFVEQWVKCLLWPISLWKFNKASSRSQKKIWPHKKVFDDEGEVWGCNGVGILMKHRTRGENCLSGGIPAIFVVSPASVLTAVQQYPYITSKICHMDPVL